MSVNKYEVASIEVQVEHYHALPCSAQIFKINGKNADTSDFGSGEDEGRYDMDREPYSCKNYVWERKPAEQEVLDEYGITLAQYDEICDILTSELYVGSCGWCV